MQPSHWPWWGGVVVPHVLVHHEFVAPLEQVEERHRPVRPDDLDLPVELDHRQPPPGRGDRVPLTGVRLLPEQQLVACRVPGGDVYDGRLAGEVAAAPGAGCGRHGSSVVCRVGPRRRAYFVGRTTALTGSDSVRGRNSSRRAAGPSRVPTCGGTTRCPARVSTCGGTKRCPSRVSTRGRTTCARATHGGATRARATHGGTPLLAVKVRAGADPGPDLLPRQAARRGGVQATCAPPGRPQLSGAPTGGDRPGLLRMGRSSSARRTEGADARTPGMLGRGGRRARSTERGRCPLSAGDGVGRGHPERRVCEGNSPKRAR